MSFIYITPHEKRAIISKMTDARLAKLIQFTANNNLNRVDRMLLLEEAERRKKSPAIQKANQETEEAIERVRYWRERNEALAAEWITCIGEAK